MPTATPRQAHITPLDGILVVTLPPLLGDSDAEHLAQQVGERLVTEQAHAVLIDMTQMRMIDSHMGRVLNVMATMIRLLGAETMVAGLRPEVAMTMVELGMDLGGIPAALSVRHGLADLRARAGRSA